jgi:hypothetical protein
MYKALCHILLATLLENKDYLLSIVLNLLFKYDHGRSTDTSDASLSNFSPLLLLLSPLLFDFDFVFLFKKKVP